LFPEIENEVKSSYLEDPDTQDLLLVFSGTPWTLCGKWNAERNAFTRAILRNMM